MNVGKQSTLNDLNDLQISLEAKIEEAKNIKVGEVSQIETGNLSSGSVHDPRPSGVYHVNYPAVSDAPFDSYGMLMHMQFPLGPEWNAGLFVAWGGHVSILTREANENGDTHTTLLTDRNTITDSNGFIKAA